ncbi:protein NnrT [uncultured Roseobacter sp.]|uniref:protein NnrT n=1 Tax=uncultured Roseobacter sp. TaxID=114847 RepID=UPI002618E255|nr:protein NnrT [uncultured Roseobacter sp.]
MRFFLPLTGIFVVAGARLFAEGFDRPVPQAQSATAEFWYALACLMLILSMVAVQWLVSRR